MCLFLGKAGGNLHNIQRSIIVSAIVGAAAAKAVGGNAGAGATSAASGTKWNYLLEWQYRRMQEEVSKAVTEDEKSAIHE